MAIVPPVFFIPNTKGFFGPEYDWEKIVFRNLRIARSNYQNLADYYNQQRITLRKSYANAIKIIQNKTIEEGELLFDKYITEMFQHFENIQKKSLGGYKIIKELMIEWISSSIFQEQLFKKTKNNVSVSPLAKKAGKKVSEIKEMASEKDHNELKKLLKKIQIEGKPLKKQIEDFVINFLINTNAYSSTIKNVNYFSNFQNAYNFNDLINSLIGLTASSAEHFSTVNKKEHFVDFSIFKGEKEERNKPSFYTDNDWAKSRKGYINEYAAALVIQEFFNQLNIRDNMQEIILAKGVGAKNGRADIVFTLPNIKNKHIIKTINPNRDFKTNEMKEEIKKQFRLQQKSWGIDIKQNSIDKSLKIQKIPKSGSLDLQYNTKLYNKWTDSAEGLVKHSFTSLIVWLSQFGKDATDDAVLWGTAHKMFWTADLIEAMSNSNYYFRFPWSKNKNQKLENGKYRYQISEAEGCHRLFWSTVYKSAIEAELTNFT